MGKNGKEVAYQWNSGHTWKKCLGLAGMGILLGGLLLGSWNMPVQSLAHGGVSEHSVLATDPPNFQKGGFAEIARQVTPAVVNITVSKQTAVPMSGLPFDPMRKFFGRPGGPGFQERSPMTPSPRVQGPFRTDLG